MTTMYRPTEDSTFKCSAEAIKAQIDAYLESHVIWDLKVKMGAVVWVGLGGGGVVRPLNFLQWMDDIMWGDEIREGCYECGAEIDTDSVVWYGYCPLCEECAKKL